MGKVMKYKAYNILYFVILLSVSLPIVCNDIPAGGDSSMWIARVDSLKNALLQGRFELFPTAELVVAYGGQGNAFDSNLWLLVPGLLQIIVNHSVFVYRVFMLLLQIGTLFASISLFRTLFRNEWTAFWGTFFYMTWPYRLYITYDQVNWARCIAFMFMPVFVWIIFRLYTETGKRKWKTVLIGAMVWAGIAYADWVVALILAAATMVSVVWYRKWIALLSLCIGVALYFPGIKYLLRYLIKGGMEQWNLPLGSIMPNGYSVGRFLVSFMYKDGQPGIGLGLLGAIMVLLGLWFTKSDFKWQKQYNFPIFATVVLLVASLQFFPWDLAQRMAAPFMRMIGLWESPAVFFGCAGIPLSILGAYAIEEAGRDLTFSRLSLNLE